MDRVFRRLARFIVAVGHFFAAIPRVARTTLAGVRLLLDPNRLNDVFVLDRGLTNKDALERIVAAIRRDPVSAAALEMRRRIGAVELARLESLEEGTLGRAFYEFLAAHGLDPQSIPTLAAEDEQSFVLAHLYETHDLWHVVTGFDTDVAGELGLQAFYSAQLDGALPRLLIIGGLLNAVLKAPRDFGARMAAIARGWELGQKARPLFGVEWNQLWTTPLPALRAQLALG